jgi:STE24 endopeptidase
VTSRSAAAVALVVLGAALVAVLAFTTPWTPAPAPAGGRTQPSVGTDFTQEQHAREDRFHVELRPWSYANLALGLLISLVLGLTPVGARIVELVARPLGGGWAWQAVLGGLALGVIGRIVSVPLSMRSEVILRRYGLSTQTWSSWWVDTAKSWAISAVLGALALLAVFAIIRATPRWWWAWAAAGAAVLVFVLSFAYPVLFEPIFNKFTPMPDTPLRAELVAMADRDGVPVKDVLVADASRRTTALNAYVSGYGASRRIVVYDTLLRDAPPAEVKLVVAHELGHAKRNDVLYGTAIGALGTAAGVCLLYLLLSWAPLLRRAGVDSPSDPRSVGLLLALLAIFGLLSMPVQNLISRRIEARADEHALELTRDPETFIQMQRRLAVQNLSDLDPNPFVYVMFGSHPTGPERIAQARDYAKRVGLKPRTAP